MEFERLLFKNWRAVTLFLYRRQDRMAIKALCIQRHRPLPETSQSSSGWGLRSGHLGLAENVHHAVCVEEDDDQADLRLRSSTNT